MPLYKVLRNVKHNSVQYQAGDTIELDEQSAEQLLASGAIEPAGNCNPSEASENQASDRADHTGSDGSSEGTEIETDGQTQDPSANL